jgi:branched-chain amino acid transport system permease protein
VTTGAIYALLALAILLVFTVTRVLYVPQGEFVMLGAMTLATLQTGKVPGTVSLLLTVGALALLMEIASAIRRADWRPLVGALPLTVVAPLVLLGLSHWLAPRNAPLVAQIALTLAIVVPIGPLIYRIAFQPVADASVLVLLIVAIAVHYALVGLGLLFFGPEGWRTPAFTDLRLDAGPLVISGQSLVVLAVSLALIAALWAFFRFSYRGKALRATAINRIGARLVGIRTESAGKLAFALSALIGAFCGVLFAPLATVYYDTGFLIGLKGFVATVIGGMVSYPLSALGALLVGVLESFSSFWASALKDALVFTLLIPVLLWRSIAAGHAEEEEEA